MQELQPRHQQISVQQWQIYQPKDQGISIFKAFNLQIKNLLKLVISLCILYLILTLLSPLTIFVISLLSIASIKLIKIITAEIRKQGLANKLNQKWRQILFEKSIFDIYSDLLYFPLVTKIIGAFIKPLIAKPHPQQLHHTFQKLPQNIQQAISRKGLLSLAPSKIQQIVIDPQRIDNIPNAYGVESWQWKNFNKYDNYHQKVHEQTIVKKIVEKIDQKISWIGFFGMASLVSIGIYRMNPNRLKNMMVQNGSFVGILLVSLIALIKIKRQIDSARKKKQQQNKFQAFRFTLLDKDQ